MEWGRIVRTTKACLDMRLVIGLPAMAFERNISRQKDLNVLGQAIRQPHDWVSVEADLK